MDVTKLIDDMVKDILTGRPGRVRVAVTVEEYQALERHFADKGGRFHATIMAHPLIIVDKL